MKQFRTNLKLVIKKQLCGIHDSFPGVESYYNYVMLSVMSKDIFNHLNTISFEFYIHFFSNIMSNLIAFVNLICKNRCILF